MIRLHISKILMEMRGFTLVTVVVKSVYKERLSEFKSAHEYVEPEDHRLYEYLSYRSPP